MKRPQKASVLFKKGEYGIASKFTAKTATKIITAANSVNEITAGAYGCTGRKD